MKALELTRRGLVLGALGFAAASGTTLAADAAAPIPVQAFFEKPAISEATISPTGRHVALVALNKDGRNQLVVVDTATMKPFVAAASRSLDVANVRWASDRRLVYSLQDPDQQFSRINAPLGIYAVDRDGSEHRDVLKLSNQSVLRNGYYPRLLATSWKQDGEHVFVGYPQMDNLRQLDHVLVRKIDTRTGQSVPVEGPARPSDWDFGPGDMPRIVTAREDGLRSSIWQLQPDGKAWTKVRSYDLTGAGGFDVVGFADEATAYVLHRNSDGYKSLYTWDLKSRELSKEPILASKGFDVRVQVVRTADRVLGFRYLTDAESTAWVDPAMKKAQEQVDKLLPSTINSLRVPQRGEVPLVLVQAYSDVNPGQYYLFDTASGQLQPLGAARPSLDQARMAHLDFVRYKARDGLEIPAWVTVPRGPKQPRPMVVLVHGGPWVRGGEWRWEPMRQFLASRGYVVLEPEFRGSKGYGDVHFKAGFKQWGLAMQDDVADGTRWAVAQGLADPKRICIAGASYGGYATLMGLVKDPDLYKCGINWVGVTDIEMMYTVNWSDFPEEYKEHGMPVLVADRQKDAAQIKATSPVQQATRVTQPLLMAYGGEDDRVPIAHGVAFRDAVARTNSNVEWVVYPEEGHGWRALKNNVDFWTRVEKFLAKNIGQ